MPIGKYLSHFFITKPTEGNQSVSGANGVRQAFPLQKTSKIEPWAALTAPLEGGHNGKHQYVNKRVGYCEPRFVA